MSVIRDVLAPLRQPEYTGENRCIPCTVVNLSIAAVASAAAWTLISGIAAIGVAVVSVSAIVLRGYLVPGTPTLTKRYLPDRVLATFDKGPAGGRRVGTAGPTAVGDDEASDRVDGGGNESADVEGALVSAGLLAECEDRDDLCLTEAFRETWRRRVDDVDGDESLRRVAGEIFSVDPHRISFDRWENISNVPVSDEQNTFCIMVDGTFNDEYESRSAFLADAAAVTVLAERHARWVDLSASERRNLLGALRLFLDFCPGCGGSVSLSEGTVESCCRSFDVVSVACDDCGDRLLELNVTDM